MGSAPRHHVVIIGGGFAGLNAARRLRRVPCDVTLVDRQNYHLFQPLLYQVATGALSAAEVAAPLRSVLKRQRNTRVLLGEVVGIDPENRQITMSWPAGGGQGALAYDTLIVAGGSRYSYFGHDRWREHAPDLKTLDSALRIRSRILGAFEAAEVEQDADRRRNWLTFVVVGGGPTGVEMAGQIAELAHDTLRRDFRSSDTQKARVLLIEAADHVLGTFPEPLRRKAADALEKLGVTPLPGHTVIEITADSVDLRKPDGQVERIGTHTVVWAAGVYASGLAQSLAAASGLAIDGAGRIAVGPDLALPGHPEILALGDMVALEHADGTPAALPGLAPVAIQQGRYAARLVRDRLQGRATPPFRYIDKGNLATIGRLKAVGVMRGVRVSGLPAWTLWLAVHLIYLIGFQNRLLVILRWTFSFVTHGRGARLIQDGR